MFDAQYLPKGAAVFSPWFPRQGDSIQITLDVVGVGGSPTLQVKVYTRKSEDPGDGDEASSGRILSATATGQSSKEWENNLNDLVRYRFEIPTGGANDWVLFRMLDPVWYDDVRATS